MTSEDRQEYERQAMNHITNYMEDRGYDFEQACEAIDGWLPLSLTELYSLKWKCRD